MDKEIEDNGFIKYDVGKPKYHLVPPRELKQLVQILTFGAEKYGENNWQLCENPDRYIDALFRHVEAFRAGQTLDEETRMPHLAHALCCCLFCLYFDNERREKWQNNLPNGI